ncbi:hypothetical protein Moror_15148 [Moniliophthora roreri MCA 2997]|uniref:Uncharacterized protein n=1 Tax=Moniliophthora roreri (strain MCA 2997) TaxID=1381753 RepID=V2X1Z1_MONRO|nr:hypothetical protein Moror_15148 [Moniliophthora roreri MCA 2997]
MVILTVMLYVYGIYTVLFIISLRILVRRPYRPNRALYLFFIIALFTLTSALNIVETFAYARQATLEFTFMKNQDWASFLAYLQHNSVGTIILGFEMALPLCLVFTADLMLLHRCYVIWGSSKRILFPMIFVMLSLAICDIVATVLSVIGINNYADPVNQRLYIQGSIIDEGFWWANMGVNIILTLLTAGRIWWISHEARKYMGPAIKTKYNTIVAIILESGIIYPILLTAATLIDKLADPDRSGSAPVSLWIVTYQVAGIAPTLIIIWAAEGKTVEHTSMNQALSTLHFVEGAGPGLGNSDTILHVQTADIEASLSVGRIRSPGEEKAA